MAQRRLWCIVWGMLLATAVANAYWPLGGSGSGSSSNTWFGATLPTLPTGITTTNYLTYSGTVMNTTMPASLSCTSTNHGSCFIATTSAQMLADLASAASDAGDSGDIIECVPGTAYQESVWTLPARSNGSSGTVYIISEAAPEIGGSGLPSQGTRVTAANASDMCSLQTSTTGAEPVMNSADAASGYRFVGIDFNLQDSNGGSTYVIELLHSDTSTSTLDSYIVFDRDLIEGAPTNGVIHALNLDGQYMAVIESACVNVFSVGDADNQCIWIANSTGPYKINDNLLQADGQNFFSGGTFLDIPGVLPSDIEIQNNDLVHNAWVGTLTSSATSATVTVNSTTSGVLSNAMVLFDSSGNQIGQILSGGGTSTLTLTANATESLSAASASGRQNGKNSLEFKMGERVLVNHNYIENCGSEGQNYAAAVFTARNNGAAPQVTDSDVTVTNNTFTNCSNGGWNFLFEDTLANEGGGTFDTTPTERELFRNNLVILNGGSSNNSGFLFSSQDNDFDVSYTANVAGASSGTLTSAIANGSYTCVFGYNQDGVLSGSDNSGTLYTVTVTGGTSASWSPALPSGTITSGACNSRSFGGSGSSVAIDHNTFVFLGGSNSYFQMNASVTLSLYMALTNIAITNNLFDSSSQIEIAGGSGSYSSAMPPNITDGAFLGNVMTGGASLGFPSGNYEPTSEAAVGFSDYGSATSIAGYELCQSSGTPSGCSGASAYHGVGVSGLGLPYTSSGTPDGTDAGANISLLPTS